MAHYRTIRYRLHPNTKAKVEKRLALSGACRYVGNHFMGKLRDDDAFYGQCDFSGYSNNKLFTVLRYVQKDGLQDYLAAIVRHTVKPIETAYPQFFNCKGGFPRFHGRHAHSPPWTCPKGAFKLNRQILRQTRDLPSLICGELDASKLHIATGQEAA